MKNLINTIKSKTNALIIRTTTAIENKRAEGFVDTGVKIIIAVVVGAVILGGLYALFDSIIERLENEGTRYRYWIPPRYVATLVGHFRREPVLFKESDVPIAPPNFFVSQDRIMSVLAGGSNVSQSKYRIYSFFLRNRDNTKRADFLKKEYGIGGHSNGRVNEEHSGKGLVIGYRSGTTHEKVLLKWPEVAKRIDRLIRAGKYFNPQEMDFDAYEKEQVARAVRGFYSNKDLSIVRPFEKDRDLFDEHAVKDILRRLDDPEQVQHILSAMQEVFSTQMPGGSHYEYDQKAVETVKAYSEGRYNLFPGSPYRRKKPVEAVQAEEVPTPAETTNEPPAEDFADTEYDLTLGATVYIGKDEMEIISLSAEKVELFDGTLIPLDLPTDVFLARLRENPLNDSLLKEPRSVPPVISESVVPPAPKKPRTRKGEKQTVESVAASLAERFEQWDEYYTEGGHDPTWSDGVNLHLLRNHIIYHRKELEELCTDGNFPEIYSREVPPEVPSDYMAQPDRIRENARRALEIYKANSDYQWCRANLSRISQKERDKHNLPTRLSFVTALEEYIEKNQLIAMRRHSYPERYVDGIEECRHLMESLLERVDQEAMRDNIYESLMNGDAAGVESSDDEPDLYDETAEVPIPTIGEQIEKYVPIVSHAVAQDSAYCNACGHSDRENAVMEGGAAIRRAVLNLHDDELLKLFSDSSEFRDGLYPRVMDETYAILHEQHRPMSQEDVARSPEKPSGLFEKYELLKESYPGCVLVVRVGDFYEFFDESATLASEKLGLMLVSREFPDGNRYPMCGIPYHRKDEFFQKLLDADLRVAVYDEDGPMLMEPSLVMAENEELDAIDRFLDSTHLYDIQYGYNNHVFYARDSQGNRWTRNEFYDLLVNEVVDLDENERLVPGYAIPDGTMAAIVKYAKQYGVVIHTVPSQDRMDTDEQEQSEDREDETPDSIILPDKGDEIRGMYAAYFVGDKFYVDHERREVTWVYYVDEHMEEGGFVINVAPLDVVRSIDTTLDTLHFFAELSMLSEQTRVRAEMPNYRLLAERFLIDPVLAEGMTEDTRTKLLESCGETDRELLQAKQLIHTFCADEYLQTMDDFSDLHRVAIGYTTITDDEIPVQAYADLVDFKIKRYLADRLIETRQYGSLKELIDCELVCLAFDDLTSVDDAIVEQYQAEHLATTMPTFQEPTQAESISPARPAIPDASDEERHDYRIPDGALGGAGPKEKFRRNMDAINLLHLLEVENRLATPEEQAILAQYTGWGGLADAFDASRDSWQNEYRELQATLTPEEYEAAKESTLTAFYTPPVIIKAIYEAIGNMGFTRGNILEPSCGVGNFLGFLPESMRESRVYGVELDSLSGRMAKHLYQRQSITVGGFESTAFPDSFFDVAVGNVPFGQFKVLDRQYDKHNFLIHDYFFAKALDKVRPGGVVAFITSKGTMDKENPAVRRYLAQRADLIGAIRLPDNAFGDAGTRVVSDIIFLQKRDRVLEEEPDWVHLGKDENGITMNQYFVDHPDMILGETVMRSGPFGPEPTCKAYEGDDLGELLTEAIANIHAEVIEVERDETEQEDKSIPADPDVKNYSYTLVKGKVYYRVNSLMNPVETSLTGENRIKGMIALRDTVHALIDAQLRGASDEEVHALQAKLNEQYDRFTAKYGLINSRGNAMVFSDDDSYFLLCSLEILDDNQELKAKADMFTKRTIKPLTRVEHVDTASEALAVSIGERATVDLAFMSELTGKSEDELYADLRGVIFLDPLCDTEAGERRYIMADEYLSGNVREKLAVARKRAEEDPASFSVHVEALEKVQPTDLTPTEIGVRLGTTWVPEEDVQAFVYELLETPYYLRRKIHVKYNRYLGKWLITEKTADRVSIKVNSTYGTKRVNAYEIIEDALNLCDVRVFDYKVNADGSRTPILNKPETTVAQGKQEMIRRAFEDWIWRDQERRERLCRLYNEKFNSTRPREFDGSHIRFYGMNPEIRLRKHQADAVARIMYGGNTLLAHVVGAGKTFTMVAAAMESKRLGLCHKSMIVVPNHLIEQWASEFLQLYPSANILVATKKDFEKCNRKKFFARIATGDYDAIIVGHSQFEKISMSPMMQIRTINEEIDAVMGAISEARQDRRDRVTVKRLASLKKQLETKLKRLTDQTRKDDVLTFEEMGIDRLFVDEAHYYKNLSVFTKMRNVAGIAQGESKRASDLYMKCRYLDSQTGGKGCIFATGTPISNTMVEMYTMQRYLQYDELWRRGLTTFDEWASTFGETVTAVELSPEGYTLIGR